MSLFFKILLVLAAIAVLIVPEFFKEEPNRKITVACSGAFLFLFIFGCSFVIIPTGYTGVRTTFGQIDSTSVRNGFNWKIPFVQSIEQVNNKQQDLLFEDKIWSETSTRTAIYYENVVVTYQINPESSAWIYANVSDYKSSLVSPSLVSSAVKASSKTVSDSDATNRSIIEPMCAENLQQSLNEKYGENVIYVNKVTINNADFDEAYNKAIADKQRAQLEAEKQSIENKKAIEKAEADAEATRKKAQGEADARLIKAESEAKANEMLANSLNEKILREQWINKWDGKLPEYMTGDSSNVMFGFGSK